MTGFKDELTTFAEQRRLGGAMRQPARPAYFGPDREQERAASLEQLSPNDAGGRPAKTRTGAAFGVLAVYRVRSRRGQGTRPKVNVRRTLLTSLLGKKHV